MTRWLHPPERARSAERAAFDPVVEGARHGLPREQSLALWQQLCDEAGRGVDLEQIFLAIAAARGARQRPAIGRLTSVDAELGGKPLRVATVPGRTLRVDEPAAELELDDYRVLGLRDVLRQLGPDHPRRAEVVAAAVSVDRSIAGRATAWREPLSDAATPHGEALWQVAEQRAATLYRHAANAGAVDEHDPALEAALGQRGRGEPLPIDVRGEVERELGISLANVRIHTDAAAARAALAVDAEAFTVGDDVFFAQGAFAPDTRAGRKLIAHELAHVAQAVRGESRPAGGGLRVSQPGEPLEREAESIAERVDQQPDHEPPALPESQSTRSSLEAGAHSSAPLAILRTKGTSSNGEEMPDNKLWTALGMAVEDFPDELKPQLLALLADKSLWANLMIGLTAYFILWMAPEPVFTKATAILATASLMMMRGVIASQLVLVARAFMRLRAACEAAKTPDELRSAARDFAHVLGAAGANAFVMALMYFGGKALPARPPGGPGMTPQLVPAGGGMPVPVPTTAAAAAAIEGAGGAIAIGPGGQIIYMTAKADQEAGSGGEKQRGEDVPKKDAPEKPAKDAPEKSTKEAPEKSAEDAGKEHVHKGGIESDPQSPYRGKWDGSGVHDWDELQAICARDSYRIKNVTEDPASGVRRVEIERTGVDPKTKAPVKGTIKKTIYPKELTAAQIDEAGDLALKSAVKKEPGTKLDGYGSKSKADGSPADGFFEATVKVGSPPRNVKIQGWFKETSSGAKVITSHAPAYDKSWPNVAPENY